MFKRYTLAAAAAAFSLALPSAQAADPASGSITPDNRAYDVTGGPYYIPNVTSQTEYVDLQGAPLCQPGTPICDAFDLTLDLPADFYSTNPHDVVKFTMTWDAATGQEDYDFFLMSPDGAIVAQGEGTTNPESMQICAGEGVQNYQVQIIPWNALGATYNLKVEMITNEKVRCKDPSPGSKSAEASNSIGGSAGLGLLLPLLGFAGLRRRS